MPMKRIFGFLILAGLTAFLSWGCSDLSSHQATPPENTSEQNTPVISSEVNPVTETETGEFVLPALPYSYDALNRYIDQKTMTVHHDKHHAGYVKNLNAAIAKHPEFKGKSVETLLRDLNDIPEDIRTAVRNNGGGHANHTMFWEIMTPESSGEPTGPIAEEINTTFGDVKTFQETFNTAGKKRFGSGWVWLILNSQGKLEITTTPNQDSPFLDGNYPILGNDVWEHAYYLKYQNRRGDYLDAWWNVVNWDIINQRLEAAKNAQTASFMKLRDSESS